MSSSSEEGKKGERPVIEVVDLEPENGNSGDADKELICDEHIRQSRNRLSSVKPPTDEQDMLKVFDQLTAEAPPVDKVEWADILMRSAEQDERQKAKKRRNREVERVFVDDSVQYLGKKNANDPPLSEDAQFLFKQIKDTVNAPPDLMDYSDWMDAVEVKIKAAKERGDRDAVKLQLGKLADLQLKQKALMDLITSGRAPPRDDRVDIDNYQPMLPIPPRRKRARPAVEDLASP